MSFRDRIKSNVPKVDLSSIVTLIGGSYKAGKTRLWKEVTELHYPNDKNAALLIAWEQGFETWHIENFIDMNEVAYAEADRWAIFKKEVVPGLVEEAKTGRACKLIGIDTVDKCIDAATAYVLQQMGKKYGKTFTSLQEIAEITKTENGWTLLYTELFSQFDKLRNAGYGLVYLAWTKEKETTLYDDRKYVSVELMMHNTARRVFESQASFICCLHNEVTIYDKSGNELEENLKSKSGKDISAKSHETKVYMYFRPTQYISIAGGRFINLPEKLPYSAAGFLQVFEDAVKGQLNNPQQIDTIKQSQEQEKEVKARQFVEHVEQPPAHSADDVIQFITDAISSLASPDARKVAATHIKTILGVANATEYKRATDTAKLLECLSAIKGI